MTNTTAMKANPVDNLNFDALNTLFPEMKKRELTIYTKGNYKARIESFEWVDPNAPRKDKFSGNRENKSYDGAPQRPSYLLISWRFADGTMFDQRLYEGYAPTFCKFIKDQAQLAYFAPKVADKSKIDGLLRGKKCFDLELAVRWATNFDVDIKLDLTTEYGWQLSIVNPYSAK